MAITLCTTDDVYRVSGLNSTVVSIANMTNFIEEAEAEIKRLTNKWWGGQVSAVEYYNRRKSLWRRKFPSQIGYIYSDTSDDELLHDFIMSSFRPITSIQRAYILIQDVGDLEQVWSDDGGVFTDNTDDANEVGGTAFNAFAAVPANNDALYIGNTNNQFENVTILLATAGVDTGATTLAYEYWNGAAWTAITGATDNTNLLQQDGTITFEAPRDWAETTVNGSDSMYYIRIRITNADYGTAPTISQIYMNDEIDEELNVRDIRWFLSGKIQFLAHNFSGGIKDLKIRYSYGAATVPHEVRDLCASLAALRALISMMGGSYDDVTSYSVPEYTASKGEPYTNMRATVIELHKKIYGWSGGERGSFDPGLLRTVGVDVAFAVSGIDESTYNGGV